MTISDVGGGLRTEKNGKKNGIIRVFPLLSDDVHTPRAGPNRIIRFERTDRRATRSRFRRHCSGRELPAAVRARVSTGRRPTIYYNNTIIITAALSGPGLGDGTIIIVARVFRGKGRVGVGVTRDRRATNGALGRGVRVQDAAGRYCPPAPAVRDGNIIIYRR